MPTCSASHLPEGDSTMDELLDMYENKGKNEAYRQTATNLFKNGASFDLVVASIPDFPKDEIQKIFDSITKNNN